jgi:asparagine synthase (glutamine-hydrolysing)
MADAIHHRGPDGRGIQRLDGATLIHARLSIIDLSPAGAQPMANEDGTVWTTFNGEIFNHRELRQWLESRGHRFRGRSDTEILPHLWEEEGPAFVSRLRGQFALSIYDPARRTLFLARDRFGIKPLFYAETGGGLAFASELRALLDVPGVDLSPEPQALSDLAALFCIPAPLTFYRGIRALEPGATLTCSLRSGRLETRTGSFHQWSIAPDPSLTLEQAVSRAAELAENGVRSQLESDVPLGAMLSGGIDSSLVSAYAQKNLAGRLNTYNVQFSSGGYDETGAAKMAAAHIGSNHQTISVDPRFGDWDEVTDLLRHAGQPFADTSVFGVQAVTSAMREHVTVALSGDGGDEAFGGYRLYGQLAGLHRWRTLPAAAQSSALLGLRAVAATGRIPRRFVGRMEQFRRADDPEMLRQLFGWTQNAEHAALIGRSGLLPVRRLFERMWEHRFEGRVSPVERLSALATEVNTRLILPNDFLFKVDIASMRSSLEVRVPMLDEELFALGLTLPHALKVDGRDGKRVLRQVARRVLPAELVTKPKQGFSVPFDTIATPAFKVAARETLLDPNARIAGWMNPDVYRPIVEAFAEGRSLPAISREGLYQRTILFLSTELALAGVGRPSARPRPMPAGTAA